MIFVNMTKQTGEESKLLIVKQILQQKETIYSIAKQFNLSKETVRRWVRNYQENGNVKRKQGERESYKVTRPQILTRGQPQENSRAWL